MKDEIKIEVLPDGSLKLEFDRVSGPNHISAEALLHQAVKLCGGSAKQTRKQGHGTHGHQHSHGEQHHH